MLRYLLFFFLFPVFGVFAEDLKVQSAVDAYYDDVYSGTTFIEQLLNRGAQESVVGESKSILPQHRDPNCREPRPRPRACVDRACDYLGTFGCDDIGEIERVQRACRGNRGDECLVSVCSKLGTFGCDDIGEIENVTGICRGQFDGECLDAVCGYLGVFGCDDFSEVQWVGQTCRGWVDTECVRSVCDRLGTFGCDDQGEIERVVNSCRGY